MKLGIDVGAVAAKVVVMSDNNKVIESHYHRTKGQPVETVLGILDKILRKHPAKDFKVVAATGTGGKLMVELLGAQFVNEIIAQATGTTHFHPEVQTIVEIGGEDSKMISLSARTGEGASRVTDFAANGICAAGTGSFLDQQASRMGIPIEEFGDVALKSAHPPRVAGRCSVFAKTDMIHLQQVGAPLHDIIAGLCFAMVRNFMGNVVRGRELRKPVAFQGGVAANKCIRRAILEVMELKEGEMIVPEHFAALGAIGAVLTVEQDMKASEALHKAKGHNPHFHLDLVKMRDYLATRKYEFASLAPLKGDNYRINVDTVKVESDEKVEAYVGIDVGSISTNVVVIDAECNVISRQYLMTAGRPIEAVISGLYEVGKDIGSKVVIYGTGSTGSGRYMTGEFFGADVIRNEITSHAKAAAFVCPDTDTIFEIGGQDAKYISLDNGTIVDFTMNKVCAAGTGSFLEEQAEKLDVKIDQEFGRRALDSKRPLDLGERCTVFMESQLNFHKQKGASREDLLGGLAYSVVKNYLNKVVEDHRVGENILFQGGVGFNRAVKAAFENVIGKKITVPPHHDILGAVGAAMLAMDDMKANPRPTRFKGFDLRSRKYELSSFECKDCANLCEIHKVVFGDEAPLFYGSRCGKYDSSDKKEQRKAMKFPRLFDERAKALLNTYVKDRPDKPNGKTVGIIRASIFHELYPLWKAFFTELGFQVVVSDPTNRNIVRQGVENVVGEPCFPIKLAHGHVLNLLEKEPDFIFLPVQCNMGPLSDDFERSWNCPLIQGLPYTLRSSIDFDEVARSKGSGKPAPKVITHVFHFDRGRKTIVKTLGSVAKEMGVTKGSVIDKAADTALTALDSFNEWQEKRGAEVLAALRPDEKAIVILGRPYNTCDPGITLNLPDKLREMGILAIPLDFIPLKPFAKHTHQAFPNMYWKSGQKILAAGRMIADDPRLFGLYLTNFACGPDSYLFKFFTKETEGKPFLTIEIDEHSSDVGILTRCEAFLDTIRNAKTRGVRRSVHVHPFVATHATDRVVYIPYMDDHGYAVAAAMRSCGVQAEALPMADEETLEIGRKFTSGKECFPSIVTTGDIVKKTRAADFMPNKAAFFMPSAKGPCRFGQYNKLHRIVLDELGLEDVPMLVLDQMEEYQGQLESLGPKFRLLAWRGLVMIDLMQKVRNGRRPYEAHKGETDKVYADHLDKLTKFLDKGGGDFADLAKHTRKAFDAVKIDKDIRKPKIGFVGEIYVRSNQFSNDFVLRKLEALGAECALPPMEEWLDYIDWERKERYKLGHHFGQLAGQKLAEMIQEREAEKIRKQYDGAICHFMRESGTEEVLKLGSRFFNEEIKGESILSMGRAVEYVHHGFDGIMNLMPFGCMPGTIVSALLYQFRDIYDGIPVFNLVLDSQKDPGQEMRLEAFYHQCNEHMRKREKQGQR